MPDMPPDDLMALARMQAIAAELSAARLTASLHRGRDSIHVTATVKPEPGGREIDVVVDEDNYVELNYLASPVATPSQLPA